MWGACFFLCKSATLGKLELPISCMSYQVPYMSPTLLHFPSSFKIWVVRCFSVWFVRCSITRQCEREAAEMRSGGGMLGCAGGGRRRIFDGGGFPRRLGSHRVTRHRRGHSLPSLENRCKRLPVCLKVFAVACSVVEPISLHLPPHASVGHMCRG